MNRLIIFSVLLVALFIAGCDIQKNQSGETTSQEHPSNPAAQEHPGAQFPIKEKTKPNARMAQIYPDAPGTE